MNIIEQIKAEIERRKEESFKQKGSFAAGRVVEDADILSFLSTLESEKAVSNNAEEAAKEYARYHYADAFSQELAENDFLAGSAWKEEQMMKEAIPCKVFYHDGPLLDYTQEQQDSALERIGAHVGDKVSIIVIPNTDEK